jgi:tetratricopeptide (TPR) repeat protein
VPGQNLGLFFRIYRSPRAAMAGILDEGSLLFGALAVLLVSFVVYAGAALVFWSSFVEPARRAPRAAAAARSSPPAPAEDQGDAGFLSPSLPRDPESAARWALASFSIGSTIATVVSLALLYVPTLLLIVTLVDSVGSFGVAMGRDYGPLLACTFFAWAAARLPFAVLSLALTPWLGYLAAGACWLLGALAFATLMVVALRTVFPARLASALLAVALAPVAFLAERFLGYLASPFILYWAYMYFRGDVSDLTRSFGARQSFKRHLEAATLNPRDSSAHYNLGLIHQRRRQYREASERFARAVEIDPGELDACYQLGRIAREQKRYEDAIRHFEAVVAGDEKFSRSEIWREVGATYLDAASLDNARWALEKFVARRGHDPEGLCLLAETLERQGDAAAARERYERCLEAVDTMPTYRRGELRRFRTFAARRLRGLGK